MEALEQPSKGHEVERELDDPVVPTPLEHLEDHAFVDTVGRTGDPTHRIDGQLLLPAAQRVSLEPDEIAPAVLAQDHETSRLGNTERFLEGGREALLALPASSADGDVAQRCDKRGRDIGLSHDLGRDTEVGGSLHGLTDIAQARAVQREVGDVEDGLVAQIQSLEPKTLVQDESVLADEHHHRAHTQLVGASHEPPQAIEELVSGSDRISRAEGDAEERPVGERRTPVRGEDVLLVRTGGEGVEGVAVAEWAADELVNASPISLPRLGVVGTGNVACQESSDEPTSSADHR